MADPGRTTPLIFTPEVIAAAATAKRYSAPLLLKWARRSVQDGGDALRAQLERAAAAVPESQRSRILGPLRLTAKSDDQVRGTAGYLLLAKTLSDLGWQVEYEPEVDGGTPDLRITKGSETYVVELRRVGWLPSGICENSVARIRDALDGLQFHTMISIRSASVSGSASLKPFVNYLRRLLSSSPEPRTHVFHEGGVLVVFETLERWPEPMPVVCSWRGQVTVGSNRGAIRQHLDAKLKAYKVPIIVALDFYEPYRVFDDVVDVLIGQPVIRIPVAVEPDVIPSEPELGRADDGLVFDRGASGERARSRLQAVLPFYLDRVHDGAFAVCARVIANPGASSNSGLASFSPIPRLVVVDESGDKRTMEYLDEHGRSMGLDVRWQHVP